jgi:hypothetical protein
MSGPRERNDTEKRAETGRSLRLLGEDASRGLTAVLPSRAFCTQRVRPGAASVPSTTTLVAFASRIRNDTLTLARLSTRKAGKTCPRGVTEGQRQKLLVGRVGDVRV